MNLPATLKCFSLIYEYRLWLLLSMTAGWLIYGVVLFRKGHPLLPLLLALPLVIQPVAVATTWCGWYYRMELRDRFAQDPEHGNAININRMPPPIQAEYARHDYRPRFRDVKLMIVWNVISLLIIIALLFLIRFFSPTEGNFR